MTCLSLSTDAVKPFRRSWFTRLPDSAESHGADCSHCVWKLFPVCSPVECVWGHSGLLRVFLWAAQLLWRNGTRVSGAVSTWHHSCTCIISHQCKSFQTVCEYDRDSCLLSTFGQRFVVSRRLWSAESLRTAVSRYFVVTMFSFLPVSCWQTGDMILSCERSSPRKTRTYAASGVWRHMQSFFLAGPSHPVFFWPMMLVCFDG